MSGDTSRGTIRLIGPTWLATAEPQAALIKHLGLIRGSPGGVENDEGQATKQMYKLWLCKGANWWPH